MRTYRADTAATTTTTTATAATATAAVCTMWRAHRPQPDAMRPVVVQALWNTPPTAADALCSAAENGNIARVRRCLAEGTSASALDGFIHFPALKHAAVNGHLDVMDVLLRHGADIDGRGSGGLTALHFAAITFKLEALQLLVDRGACVSATDERGGTSLMAVLSNFLPCRVMDDHKLAVVACLLEAGAAVYGHALHRLSALTQVVRAPYFSIPPPFQRRAFDLLVAHGADVHERDSKRRTALHYAAQCNNFDMVVRLLALGVDMAAVDNRNQTAREDAAAFAGDRGGGDTRARELLDALHRRVRDKPKMHAFAMGLRAVDERCSVRVLSIDLVHTIFGAAKPDTAYERELNALAEVQLRRGCNYGGGGATV